MIVDSVEIDRKHGQGEGFMTCNKGWSRNHGRCSYVFYSLNIRLPGRPKVFLIVLRDGGLAVPFVLTTQTAEGSY